MLEAKIETALNKQINHELTAAYGYLAMAAYFETTNLAGFAAWMHKQRQEELEHAMRLFRYVNDRGGRVVLDAVPQPRSDFDSVREVFNRALETEQHNTKAIHDLYGLATQLKDYATQSHLQWFIDEQVEEEKLMNEILSLLELAGDNKAALLALNNQVAKREA